MNKILALLKSYLAFAWEHLPLVIVTILVAWGFLNMDKFAEFGYGVLRLGVVILAAFALIHFVFKSTIRGYILEGGFKADFDASPHKLWIALGVIALIVWTATECFIHA